MANWRTVQTQWNASLQRRENCKKTETTNARKGGRQDYDVVKGGRVEIPTKSELVEVCKNDQFERGRKQGAFLNDWKAFTDFVI